MPPSILWFVCCVFVVVASLSGGRLTLLLRMTHLRTQLLMSGVGGLMIRIALADLMIEVAFHDHHPGKSH